MLSLMRMIWQSAGLVPPVARNCLQDHVHTSVWVSSSIRNLAHFFMFAATGFAASSTRARVLSQSQGYVAHKQLSARVHGSSSEMRMRETDLSGLMPMEWMPQLPYVGALSSARCCCVARGGAGGTGTLRTCR